MYRFKSLCALALLGLSAQGFSENCGQLHILISNHTSNDCTLVAQTVIHGSLESGISIPTHIDAKTDAKAFIMSQMGYGPDILLTYQCGEGKKITFESQQDACYYKAGEIKATLLDASNMDGFSQVQSGDLSGKAGIVSWIFED